MGEVRIKELEPSKTYNITLIIIKTHEWQEAANTSYFMTLFASDLTYNPLINSPLVTVVIFQTDPYSLFKISPYDIIKLEEAKYTLFEGSYSFSININGVSKPKCTIQSPDASLKNFWISTNNSKKKLPSSVINYDKTLNKYSIFSNYLTTSLENNSSKTKYTDLSELSASDLFSSINIIGEFYDKLESPLHITFPRLFYSDSRFYEVILKHNTTSNYLFLSKEISNGNNFYFTVLFPSNVSIENLLDSRYKVYLRNLMFFFDPKKELYGFIYAPLSSYEVKYFEKEISSASLKETVENCSHSSRLFLESFLPQKKKKKNHLKLPTRFLSLKYCLSNVTVFENIKVKFKMVKVVPNKPMDLIVGYCKTCKIARTGEYDYDKKKSVCNLCSLEDFFYSIFCVVIICDSTEFTPILFEDSYLKTFLRIKDNDPFLEIRSKIQRFIELVETKNPFVIGKIGFERNNLVIKKIVYLEC